MTRTTTVLHDSGKSSRVAPGGKSPDSFTYVFTAQTGSIVQVALNHFFEVLNEAAHSHRSDKPAPARVARPHSGA